MLNSTADLYLCIPTDKLDSQGRLLRLLYTTVFVLAQRQKRTLDNTIDKDVLFVMDELPALGFMPFLDKILTYGRGFKIRAYCISQTLEMLKAVYPKNWQTILASNLSVYFGVADLETAQYVSRRLGETTVELKSTSKNKNIGLFSRQSASQGESVSLTKRPLLTPDEILKLDDNKIIAFRAGKSPLLLSKIHAYKDAFWVTPRKKRGKPLHR